VLSGVLSNLEIKITARRASELDHPYQSGSDAIRSMDANKQRRVNARQGEIGK